MRVKQYHAMATPKQVMRRGQTGGTGADDGDALGWLGQRGR
jgi:hypothetical protein